MKPWTVCWPRPYKDRAGDPKTHFVAVGKAFPLKNREGFSIELWFRVIPSGELVMFPPDRPEKESEPAIPEELEAF